MEIWFGDDETAELCGCATRMATRWGSGGARAVGRRLLQIEAAPTVEDLRMLPGGLRHDSADDTWMINVSDVAAIRFETNRHADGADSVRILAVTDLPAERKRR